MHKSPEHIRTLAKQAFMAGLEAADPLLAMKNALATNPLPKLATNGRYIIISAGKAACKMAQATLEKIPDDINIGAICVTNAPNAKPIERCELRVASHPTPDESGLKASEEIIQLLSQTTQNDQVIVLISGGSSALLPAPVEGLSLKDKIAVNDILLSCGFDIYETNLIRQSLSRLKGGGLRSLAAPAQLRSYILSDVLGDDLRVVGSGPSIGPIATPQDAMHLLKSANVFERLPKNVQAYFQNNPKAREPSTAPDAYIIASNTTSLRAMANAANATIVSSALTGDVEDAAQTIVTHAIRHKGQPFAIAFGGETTVKLCGNGLGGRNQELSLRVAKLMQEQQFKQDWCFLSGGTDGCDGPTNAAGGLVDNTTYKRLEANGIEIDDILANNDSYRALKTSNDLLITGATGTNVADLQLFIGA